MRWFELHVQCIVQRQTYKCTCHLKIQREMQGHDCISRCVVDKVNCAESVLCQKHFQFLTIQVSLP